MKLTELSKVTVRHWFDTFREQLPENKELLEHIVQLDEAYFGGKKGKALFLGKQVGSRRLAWEVLNHTSPAREHAWDFLKQHVAPDTTLYTDGASIYNTIDLWWPVIHRKDIHKKFEIEGMFGVLRTFVRRMYHHVTCDKLHSLVQEFCFRFSHPEMFENPRYFMKISLHLVPTR